MSCRPSSDCKLCSLCFFWVLFGLGFFCLIETDIEVPHDLCQGFQAWIMAGLGRKDATPDLRPGSSLGPQPIFQGEH